MSEQRSPVRREDSWIRGDDRRSVLQGIEMCISFGLLAAQPRPADLNRKFMVSIGERYGEHHLSMWDVSEPGAQPRLVTSLYPVEAWKEGSFERVMAAFVEAAVQDQVEGVV